MISQVKNVNNNSTQKMNQNSLKGWKEGCLKVKITHNTILDWLMSKNARNLV